MPSPETYSPEIGQTQNTLFDVLPPDDRVVDDHRLYPDGSTMEHRVTHVSEQANYQGNWTQLQLERMQSDDFVAKFEDFFGHDSADTVELADRTQRVYSFVHYRPIWDSEINFGFTVGRGDYGKNPTTYTDAYTTVGEDIRPLTPSQKDLIVAHEMFHGVVRFGAEASELLKKGFDADALRESIKSTDPREYRRTISSWDRPPGSVVLDRLVEYSSNPEEIGARMSQLKNYFGMSGNEQFTQEHFEYARLHYVEDTELDNGMGYFFSMITVDTTPAFLELMNRMPV